MPVINSAKKKLRKDKKRTVHNEHIKDKLKALVKIARKTPTEKTVKDVQQEVDKAVKKHLLHKNKAARIKSVLAKKIGSTVEKKITTKTTKKKKRTSPKRK